MCFPGTQICSPGTQHGVLEAGPGVLEAGLGGLERLLGALNGLGRFQNALEPFQEALGGVSPRTRHPGGWIARPPKSRFFKTDQTPLELGKCLGLGKGLGKGKGLGTGKHRHKGKGKDTGQVGRMTHSRRRAKRGGGYYKYIYKAEFGLAGASGWIDLLDLLACSPNKTHSKSF